VSHEIIQPSQWPAPRGYSNAVSARGKIIAIAGQVGWNPQTLQFESDDFVDQLRVALENVVTVLAAGGAAPEHVIRMTWFITDRDAYVQNAKQVGEIYRDVFGRNYPAMSVVVASGLIELKAKIEIEATAVVPD
jgi:enamine deaminase RidA (YjgF/YER057c/UK114 family)